MTAARRDLRKEGVTSVEQIIGRLSGSTSITSTAQVVGSGTGGASFANLRGIGDDKTLILLNGRRIANNALAGSAPDLNMIPFSALERVEVLRDGASALYGTDAIGGVINFITRKSYTAGELSLNASIPSQSGGKSSGINGSVGFGNLETDRYNVMGVVDYQKTDRINSQQRAFGARGVIPERGIDGSSSTTFPANYSQRQVNNPLTGLPWNPVDADGNPVANTYSANPNFPGCAPAGAGGSLNTGRANNCSFDPTLYQDLTPQVERASLFTRGSLKLNADTVLSAEYFLTQNTVGTTIGPVPEGGLTLTSASPYYPGNGITPLPTNFTLDRSLPISVNWRTAEAGGRSQDNKNTSQRLVLNLDGLAAGWDYNLGASYNTNRLEDPLTGGYVNDAKIAAGVAGVVDPATGNTIYLNPFGAQTAAGAAYLASAALRGNLQVATGTVTAIDGRASRELGDWLGAGSQAAVAVGAEYRREKFSDQINADVASQAASTGVDPASSVVGSRNVAAVYGELNVPLVKMLDATLAVRHDRYSDFGSTTNPKVALRFQPSPQLLARATYSTGFRAPSLYELYQPNYLTFTANSYNDPKLCPGGTPNAGVDPNVACNTQFLRQGGGNAKLKPEKAKNFTLGLVFQPTRDLNMQVDFWWIRLKDAINAFPESAIFGDPVKYAGRFVRDANGTLDPYADNPGYVVATNDNLGKTNTRGIDLAASYLYRMGTAGNVSVSFNGTYVDKFEYQREIDGPYVQNAGVFVDSGTIFRWKHSLTVAYNKANWSVGVNNRFSSSYEDENVQVDPAYYNRVGSYSLWDLFGSLSPTKAVTVTAGVKNVFNTDPPFSNQGQTFQAGYDPRYTDPTGRTFYARLTYTFK